MFAFDLIFRRERALSKYIIVIIIKISLSRNTADDNIGSWVYVVQTASYENKYFVSF